MANSDAWQQGWDIGAGKKKKSADSKKTDSDGDKTDSAGTGGQTYFHGKRKTSGSDSGSSGGGWSILPVIGKALGFGGSKKKGGPIKRTGLYYLHRNEYVVPAKHRSSGKKTSHKRPVVKA